MTNIAISSSQKLEKAYLTVIQPSAIGEVGSLLGAIDAVGGSESSVVSNATAAAVAQAQHLGQTINFKFNPNQYSISKDGNWKDHFSMSATAAGPRQWLGTNPKTLSIEMLLDESDNLGGSVVADCELLFSCCSVSLLSIAGSFVGLAPSAPFVLFGWGSTEPMVATVSSVNVVYTMFHPDGTPYRAKVTLSLKEYGTTVAGQNPSSGSANRNRTCTVRVGDSLPLIAYREYRRSGYWRAIAEVNDVEDPLRIAPGTVLILPDPIEARRRSGVDNEGRADVAGANGRRPAISAVRADRGIGRRNGNGPAAGNGRRRRNGPLVDEGVSR